MDEGEGQALEQRWAGSSGDGLAAAGGIKAAMSSYDRVAAGYDDHLGGMRRGRAWAAKVAPHLVPGGLVADLGTGTGTLAAALAEEGWPVVGLDYSHEMLKRARARIPRVVQADVARLPLRSGSCANLLATCVVDVVDSPEALLAEAARVLRPGGRMVVISSIVRRPSDPVGRIRFDLQTALRGGPPPDRPDVLREIAARAGLVLDGVAGSLERRTAYVPNDIADRIERRQMHIHLLCRADAAAWRNVVAPAVQALRDLPHPDRPHPQHQTCEVIVLRRPAAS
ncbi:class I SAM-dependent methyltransferase [Spirillospora sp. CA-294931]|uniref:class I SAM-dependent methyltransferase n=1 Tax=Spirillospora sp. CA-294931 TaxID=3240042 RepID=UPI003D8CB6C9